MFIFFLKRKGIWFCNKNIKLKILYTVKFNYLICNVRLRWQGYIE